MPARFVGRAAEVAALAATIDLSLRSPGPAALIVTGDAGSGKSRLLSEACAPTSPRRVIRLQGSAPEQHVQLSAAGEMLDIVSREGSDDLRVLLARPEQIGSVVTPVRLFEATLTSLVSIGPVILVIDDFHWLDDTSVALTHYLLRGSQAAKFSLALVVASRPVPAASAFVVALTHLLGPERFRALSLDALEREFGMSLVKELSPSSTDLRAEMVWERSRGSPFWIERLAAPVDGDVGDASTLLSHMLHSVSNDGLQVLIYLAAADRSMTVDELSDLAGWEAPRLSGAIAEVARSGLLAEVMGVVRVTHQLISEAVLGFVTSEQVRRAHRRIATFLEANAGGEGRMGLRALEHRLAGGLPVEATALALAASPVSRDLGRTGIRRLFDIAGEAVFGNVDLAKALAVRAAEAGDHRLAFDLWSHLALQGESPNAAAASLAASEEALVLDLKEDAWRFLAAARRLVDADDVLTVEVDAQESFLYRWLDRRWDEATKAADRALAGVARFVRISGTVSARPRLRATLAAADAALMAGDPAKMYDLSEQMVAAAIGIDDQAYVRGLAEGALAMRLLGHNREAEDRARRAWDEARRRVLPQMAMEVGPMLARVLLSLGRLDEARRVVDDYKALGDRLAEFRPARAFQVVVPSVLEAAVGNWRTAMAMLKSAAEEETEPHYRLQAHMEQAALLARHDPQRSALVSKATWQQVSTMLGCQDVAGVWPKPEHEASKLSLELAATRKQRV